MGDLTPGQAGLHVKITDQDSTTNADVETSTPSSGAGGLAVREVERGQKTAANSIPVTIASDQSAIEIVPYDRDDLITQRTQIGGSSQTTVLTAGGSGVFHDIIQMSFSSEADAQVDIRDETGGSIVWRFYLKTQQPVILYFNPPLVQTTADNNWTVDRDTSSDDLQVMVLAVKNT